MKFPPKTKREEFLQGETPVERSTPSTSSKENAPTLEQRLASEESIHRESPSSPSSIASSPVTLRDTQFRDKYGNVWSCDLDFDVVETIDNSDFSELGVKDFSLLEPGKEIFNTLMLKTRLLMACVWIAVRDQAKKHLKVDPNEDEEGAQQAFGKCIDGATLDGARKAFVHAVGDFHPDLATGLSAFLRQWEANRKTVAEKILSSEEEMTALIKEGMIQEFDMGKDEIKKVFQERQQTLREELRRVAN